MKILFLMSFILMFCSLLFLKKDEKKRSFIFSFIFIINILYCFNIFLTYILSFINIKSDYLILTIVNIIVSFYLIFKSYKDNKLYFQKYNFNFKEIISILLLIIICILIGMVRFNKFDNIAYETTDPAVHYKSVLHYADNLQLNNKINTRDELYNNFSNWMTGFYVNCGLFINVFDFIPSYKAYLIFDVLILFLMSSTFFITGLKIKKSNKNNILLFVITCLYFGAYCMNNLIFGFGYLGVGILITNLILLTWVLLEEKKNDSKLIYCLLSLFNYSLFFSYYLFVPTLYLGQGIYLIYDWFKNKNKYIFYKNIKIGLFTLVLPFVLGFTYFILPGLVESGNTGVSSSLALEGYIYRDLWSNFVLILPIFILSFIINIRNKNFNTLFFIIIIEILFIGGTFVLGLFFNKVSSYYYFKSYYIFWLMIYTYILFLLNNRDFNTMCLFKINMYFIIFILFILVFNIESKIQNKNILFNNSITSPSIMNIYWFNASKMFDYNYILNKKELDIINKVSINKGECLSKNNEIPLLGNYLQKLWFYSITDVVPVHMHLKNNLGQFYDDNFDIKKIEKDPETKCIIIFDRENIKESENYNEIDYEKYNILFKNSSGKLLKKK